MQSIAHVVEEAAAQESTVAVMTTNAARDASATAHLPILKEQEAASVPAEGTSSPDSALPNASSHVGSDTSGNNCGSTARVVLVVDGRTLQYALAPAVVAAFVALARACSAVICARVSPSQKAKVRTPHTRAHIS